MVVAAGGDGTINEVINGLMKAKDTANKMPSVGILPVGGGNDFAYEMGGGFIMTPTALPDDGIFDLCIANEMSKITILLLILRFMKGSQVGHPAIRFDRSNSIRVKALAGSLPVHADGEMIARDCQEISITMMPAALHLISNNNRVQRV